jgi:NADPH:quinone reductase-like Zn-dependent oxidoreductase
MRQVWISKSGDPSLLETREAPDPEPGAGEIRIRVAAAGVNFADILARMGIYPDAPKPPCVVGYEVAGEVDAVGAGVGAPGPGTRVAALTRFGGYSDTVTVPREQAFTLPDDLAYEKAAALPINYLTAWLMLVRLGNVQPGERVLIHSAGGGVGLAAIQICRWRNAEILGTASSGKHPRLKEMGVHHCIDYNTRDFQQEVARLTRGRGVDVVLDAVGGKSFQKSYESLAPLGRLFLFGVSSFAPGMRRNLPTIVKGFLSLPKFKPIALMDRNRGVFGVNLGHLWEETNLLGEMMRKILELVSDRTFDPVVDRVFPFAEASAAHVHIQQRRNFGKVLLRP